MSDPERSDPNVTVAIPLFNEEENIHEVLHQVDRVLDDLADGDHEIVCIDDGSSDNTLDYLVEARSEFPRLKVISLSRNFGHQAAVSAALDNATGDVVMVMDGDLQDDPRALRGFLHEYYKGADVVYAIRRNRKEGPLRRLGYGVHYRLMARISESPVQVDAGDFALLSRRVVDLVCQLPERQRYVRGLRAWIGLKQVGVDVDRGTRFAGDSKYSIRALVRLAFDGVFAFSRVPLRIATALGAITVILGVLYGLYVLVDRIAGGPPRGFATLALLQIGFFGTVLMVLGLIGEYVGRIYEEVKQRPIYVVDRVWQPEKHNGEDGYG